MLNSKEVIVTPNGDSTYKLEFVGCELMYDGKKVEGNLIFQRFQSPRQILQLKLLNTTTQMFAALIVWLQMTSQRCM